MTKKRCFPAVLAVFGLLLCTPDSTAGNRPAEQDQDGKIAGKLGEKMNYSKCRLFPLGKITASGWLREQLARNKAGMGGLMPEIEPELIGKAYTDRNHKSHFDANWTSEIAGTYRYAETVLAWTLNDPELKKRSADWVEKVLALQESDGFLGLHDPKERFEDYCAQGNNWAYRALLAYYDATGDKRVLEAVHRALLWFVNNWTGDKKTSYAGSVIVESMINVYHLTGDTRLKNWSEEYRDWLNENDKHRHSSKAFERERLRFGEDHVGAFGELVKNPALLYTASGSVKDLDVTRSGFRQIFDRCWQVNGAPASNGEHLAPASCIHETEYCDFAIFLSSFAWMGRITGEAVWFDRMEKILFNAAQGARMKNEKAIAYMSCPNQNSATVNDGSYYRTSPGRRCYAPNYYVSCCPMQSIRIYPDFIRNSFHTDGDGVLAAACYAPVEVAPENGVTLKLDTLYPFDETVSLKITSRNEWCRNIKFRKPEWCREYSVTKNGKPVEFVEKDNWIYLSGPWKSDTVALKFKMDVRLEKVQDVWFPAEPLRAYYRGPLLYVVPFIYDITEITGSEEFVSMVSANLGGVKSTHNQKRGGGPTEKYPWYDVKADRHKLRWYAVPDPGAAEKNCRVIAKSKHGYVWEDSPVRLQVPLICATRSWDRSSSVLTMPFGNPVLPDEEAVSEMIELVPYGCTMLRQSCFPVAEKIDK